MRSVQVTYPSTVLSDIQTVMIRAGPGESMLVGRDADVYFTGEMSHVRLSFVFWSLLYRYLDDSVKYQHRSLSGSMLSCGQSVSADVRMMLMLRMPEVAQKEDVDVSISLFQPDPKCTT
ncbi:hypothetical protein EDD85DRAFT_152479 [Armillaria nabsnona]|nr:hypothetical protein EDD85DRAFT_152479 [Armillaria nabsnona]